MTTYDDGIYKVNTREGVVTNLSYPEAVELAERNNSTVESVTEEEYWDLIHTQ